MAKKPRSGVVNATETSRTDVENDKHTTDEQVATEEEPLSRRAIFGLTTLAALTGACSGSDFSGGGPLSGSGGRRAGDAIDAGDGDGGDAGDSDSDGADDSIGFDGDGDSDSDGSDLGGDANGDSDGGPINTDKDLDECRANNTQTIDTKDTPATPTDLKPEVVFYGNKATSSMIAFQFDTSKTVKSVTLLMESGQLIAFHRLTGGDKDGSEYRAIHIDNVFLNDTSTVKFLINADDKNYVHEESVSYFDTFEGTPVEDYGAHTIPAGFMSGGNNVLQSVTQFTTSNDASNFREDNTVTYPGVSGDRFLKTADNDTTWTAGGGIKGIVTDIMGKRIDNAKTANQKWISKYQTFCTYEESGGKLYRTIMKIG